MSQMGEMQKQLQVFAVFPQVSQLFLEAFVFGFFDMYHQTRSRPLCVLLCIGRMLVWYHRISITKVNQ